MVRHVAAIGLICAAVAASASTTRAQACCTATGSGEFGTVGRCSRGNLSTQLGWERAVGSHDDRGRFHRLRDAGVDDVVLTVGGGVSFWDRRMQVHGGVPLRLQHRRYGDDATTRARPGDSTLTFRWGLLADVETGIDDPRSPLPWIDLLVSLGLPTGRAPEDTNDRHGADITGDGSFRLGGGAKLSRFVTLRHALSASAVVSHRFARDVPALDGGDARFRPGADTHLRLAWTHVRDLWWSGGVFSTLRFERPAREGGREVSASRSRRLQVGAFLTWAFDLPLWETTLSVSTDPFLRGAARNVPFASTTVALSLRRRFP